MRVNAILFGLSLGVVISVSAENPVGGLVMTATNEIKNTLDGADTAAIDGTGNAGSGSFTNHVTNKRGRISRRKIEQFMRKQRRSTPLLLPDIVLPQITTQNSAAELPALPDLSQTIPTAAPVQQTPNTSTTTTQTAPPPTSIAPPTVAPPSVALPSLAPPSVAPPAVAPPTQALPVLPPTYYPPYYPQQAPAKKEDDEEEEDEDEEDEEDYDADDLKTRRRR